MIFVGRRQNQAFWPELACGMHLGAAGAALATSVCDVPDSSSRRGKIKNKRKNKKKENGGGKGKIGKIKVKN